jgi:hypothetical protein
VRNEIASVRSCPTGAAKLWSPSAAPAPKGKPTTPPAKGKTPPAKGKKPPAKGKPPLPKTGHKGGKGAPKPVKKK